MPKIKNEEDNDKDWVESPKKKKKKADKRKAIKDVCEAGPSEGLLESKACTRSHHFSICKLFP